MDGRSLHQRQPQARLDLGEARPRNRNARPGTPRARLSDRGPRVCAIRLRVVGDHSATTPLHLVDLALAVILAPASKASSSTSSVSAQPPPSLDPCWVGLHGSAWSFSWSFPL